MAATTPIAPASDDLCMVVPILAKERTPDGALYVYGKATGPQVDLDQQIADPEWTRAAMDDWFKSAANIRQMHSPHIPPAGVGVDLEEKDDGFWLRSKIVEPGAQRLVEEGVYKGYSIYIQRARVRRDDVAKNGRIVGGKVTEVSLVDYPCLPSARLVDMQREAPAAKFTLFKRAKDDTVEYIGKAADTEDDDDAGHVHDAREQAFDHEHEHTHADGTTHSHDHHHDAQAADHDGDEHGHATEDAPKAAKCGVDGCDCACTPGSADAGCSCDCALCKEARGDAAKRDYSDEQRDRMADKGQAEGDGSFPIKTPADVRNAVHDWGRAGSKESDKRHIIERAKAIGATDELPADWPGSTKKKDTDDGDREKGRVYYSNAHKDRIRAALTDVAALLRSLDPDAALIDPRERGADAPVSVEDAAPDDSAKIDMREDSKPQAAVLPATAPDFMKRAEVESLVAQAAKAAVDEAQAGWRAEFDAAKAAWAGERDALRAQIEAMGAQPDPNAAAYRGPRLAERPSALTKAAKTAEQQRREQQAAILRGWLHHGDPALRTYAEAQLAALSPAS